MVSIRQLHPISCSEVVAKIHFLGSTHGVKVATNASPAIPSKKKKKLNVSLVRVVIRRYTRWHDGVQTVMSSGEWFRRCRQNKCLAEHTWCKSWEKVNLNRGYAWCDDGVQPAMSSDQSFRSCGQNTFLGERTWCNSRHKRLPRNSVKKKKMFYIPLVRVAIRGYTRWDDGVQTAMSSDQSFRSCRQNTCLGEHTWCKRCDKVNLSTGYAFCDDGVPMATSSQKLLWSY